MAALDEALKGTTCAECGAPVSPQAVQPLLGVAACAQCGALLDVVEAVARSAARFLPARPAPGPAETTPTPENATAVRSGSTLVLGWRRGRSPAATTMAQVLGFLFLVALTGGTAALAIPFLAMGLVVLVVAAVNVNAGIELEVLPDRLRARWVPAFLSAKPTEVRRADVAQLYVVHQSSHHERGRGPVDTWALEAVLKNGHKTRVIGGLEDLDLALWLEQRLELELGIVDRPVQGEVNGRGTP